MGVHALLGLRPEHVSEGLESFSDIVHQQGPSAVGHIDAVRAVGLHQLRLASQLPRRCHVGHHQKAGDVHA